MAVPLITLTQRSVPNDDAWRYRFGGNDTQLNQSGLFGIVVQWDADANSNVAKANFVFVMKKVFVFLDKIGVGACIYGKEGFEGRIRHYATEWRKCQSTLDLNRLAREKIIRALGGVAECQKIPVVDFKTEDLTPELQLDDEYLSRGQHIVQLEDSVGRKAIVMHLKYRTGQVFTATAYQPYPETSNNGNQWSLKFLTYQAYRHTDIYSDTDSVAAFIEKVRTGRDDQFSFFPKP